MSRLVGVLLVLTYKWAHANSSTKYACSVDGTLAQWNIDDRSQVYTDVAVPDWIHSLVVEQHWFSYKS